MIIKLFKLNNIQIKAVAYLALQSQRRQVALVSLLLHRFHLMLYVVDGQRHRVQLGLDLLLALLAQHQLVIRALHAILKGLPAASDGVLLAQQRLDALLEVQLLLATGEQVVLEVAVIDHALLQVPLHPAPIGLDPLQLLLHHVLLVLALDAVVYRPEAFADNVRSRGQ